MQVSRVERANDGIRTHDLLITNPLTLLTLSLRTSGRGWFAGAETIIKDGKRWMRISYVVFSGTGSDGRQGVPLSVGTYGRRLDLAMATELHRLDLPRVDLLPKSVEGNARVFGGDR